MISAKASRILLLGLGLFGAPLANAASDWSVRVWPLDGLSDRYVTGIAQTPDGFLWIATHSSLARFDGASFEEFTPEQLGWEKDTRIRFMIQAKDGSLWVAADRGRVWHMMAGKSAAFIVPVQDGQPEFCALDGTGGFWVAYRAGQLARVSAEGSRVFGQAEGLPGGRWGGIAQDIQGRIWFVQGGKIGIARDGALSTLGPIAGDMIRIAGASGGGIWIYNGEHLYRYSEATGLVGQGSPPGGGIAELQEDRAGVLWINTANGGLVRMESEAASSVPTSNSDVTCMTEDLEGSLWVGTRSGGLNQVRPRVITIEGAVTGFPKDAVGSICEDSKGTLWGATADGRFVVRAARGWQPAAYPKLPSGSVNCVAADPAGGVWIGTRAWQLLRVMNGKATTWGEKEGLISHKINNLMVDHSGAVWIGGSLPNSLQRLSGGKLTTYAIPRQPLGASSLVEDAKGTIWMGAVEGSLLRVEGDHLVEETSFVPDTQGRFTPIHSLLATPDGAVWVAYNGAGLGRIKEGRYSNIRAAQGLGDDGLSAIGDDGYGWLWFGAANGIFKVRKQELDDLAEGKATQVQSVRFGSDQGLPLLQVTRGGSVRSLKTRDGRLWIPMGNALVIASPSLANDRLPPAPAVVTGLRIDERSVASYSGDLPAFPQGARSLSPASRLRLSPIGLKIEFEFASPSYAAPGNVNFRYKLDGFDNRWIEAGTQRFAAYPRLAAGSYRFEVKACNSAGQWSGAPAVLDFQVQPYFWQTWWFRGAGLTAFAFAIFSAARTVSHRRLRSELRTARQQAALERERARIARDIHDDVGNRLTRILLLSRLAQRDGERPTEAAEHLRQISSAAVEVTDALDEIVWAVNPRNDTLSNLIGYLGKCAVEFLRAANIRCTLDLPQDFPDGNVDAEARHSFFLVTKEALNNVVRHSGATQASFKVLLEEGTIAAVLSDNGRGFSGPADDATADGLRNMRSRMAEIGGHFEIESTVGSGTNVSYGFRWKRRIAVAAQ